MPYSPPTPLCTSHVNEDRKIVHNFLIESGVSSVDNNAMSLLEMRGNVRGRVAR